MKLGYFAIDTTTHLKCIFGVIIMLSVVFGVKAQSNTRSFTSLDLPGTAQLSALGGVNVSRVGYDVNFFQNNPALAADTLSGWASASHLFYFAGTGLSSFAYQHNFNTIGPLSFGVSHFSMGTIQGYDLNGAPTQSLNAGETIVTVGKAHQVGVFRFGVNVKGAFSNLAGYRASALLLDMGGAFVHPSKDLSIGLVINNAGVVLKEYSTTSSSSLPFDVQVGVSYKPEHMPLRFSTTVYRLSDFKIPYENNNGPDDQLGTLDKVVSHVTFGAELILHRNVNVLLGYNFLKHKELKLESAGGGSGFSIGALAKVRNMNFAFSRSGYVTGAAYQLSLGIDTNKILKRNSL